MRLRGHTQVSPLVAVIEGGVRISGKVFVDRYRYTIAWSLILGGGRAKARPYKPFITRRESKNGVRFRTPRYSAFVPVDLTLPHIAYRAGMFARPCDLSGLCRCRCELSFLLQQILRAAAAAARRFQNGPIHRHKLVQR